MIGEVGGIEKTSVPMEGKAHLRCCHSDGWRKCCGEVSGRVIITASRDRERKAWGS